MSASSFEHLRGTVIWITGVPASGKTTLALQLREHLVAQGLATLWLDSDDLRAVMTPNATYSPLERDYFYATLAHLARRATEGQICVLISATAARRTYRDSLRQRVPQFFEVWLTADAETLRKRDIKGLYFQADKGDITALPGVGVPFEAPTEAELTLDTSTLDARGVFEQALVALRDAATDTE